MRARILGFAIASVGVVVGVAPRALAAPVVWAIDDGEKIKRDVVDLPF
jgi:hypothetical protein